MKRRPTSNAMPNPPGNFEQHNEMRYFQYPSFSQHRPSTSRRLEDIFKVEGNSQTQYGRPSQMQYEGPSQMQYQGPSQVQYEGPSQMQQYEEASPQQRIGWRYGDDERVHHRTTSMHRNTYGTQEPVQRNNRNNLKTMENKRKWMSQSSTLRSQPLIEHASRIVEYMQQDHLLMDDTPEAEQLRKTALRDMPQSLMVKKIIKRKLLTSMSGERKSPGCWKMLKYTISMWFLQVKNGFSDLTYSLELWYGTMKQIEGNFGSAVSTYFRFLRWLFVLNVLITILCFGFVNVPQIIYMQGSNESNSAFSIADIFTGSGHFSQTVLFYGFYTNTNINGVYSMPVAYFFTMVVIYILMFAITSVSMAQSYRKSFIETKGGLKNVYAHKIFCGWDYGIATIKAANLKSNAIYHELQELLSDTISNSKKITCCNKFLTFTLQTIMNILIVALLGGTGYALWLLLDLKRRSEGSADKTTNAVFIALFINVIVLLFPILFRYIARYEGYRTPRTALNVTLVRIFLLKIMLIGILIVYWLTYAEEEECWETSIGQEIYRLVLFDFFFSIILITLFESVHYIIFKNFWQRIGEIEFDIARNTLSVVYNQTLFWAGLMYSPLLGVVVILKLLLTWYIRSTALMKYCVPAKKSWRASQTRTLFNILTFLSLLFVLGCQGYIMISIPVSNCGPFRDFNYIHEVFSKYVLDADNGSPFWFYLSYIGRPGVFALVLIGMSMLVYYLRARSKAQISLVKFLRGRLLLAAKDKEFLLRQISEVTKNQWTYIHQEARDDFSDPRKVVPNLQAARQGYSSSSPFSISTSENGSDIPHHH